MNTARDELRELQEVIIRCRRCPRLVTWREQVARVKVRRFRSEEYWGRPIPAFGDWGASLVIVGLAPAAHGGNRTGRMFTGDRSGDWLFGALHRHGFANQPTSRHLDDGLALADCFITAALRCPPPANKPLPAELANCRQYLRREIEMLGSARVFLTLGHIALSAFLKAWTESGGPLPDPKPDFRHGGEWPLSRECSLLASYHPSQQNTQTGRLTRPMFDLVFRRARRLLGRTADRPDRVE